MTSSASLQKVVKRSLHRGTADGGTDEPLAYKTRVNDFGIYGSETKWAMLHAARLTRLI